MIRSGLVVATISAMRTSVAGASITDGGFDGFTTNSALIAGSASLSISSSGNCHVGSSFASTPHAWISTTSRS